MLTPNQIRKLRIRARDLGAIWAIGPTKISVLYDGVIFSVENNSTGYCHIVNVFDAIKTAQMLMKGNTYDQ